MREPGSLPQDDHGRNLLLVVAEVLAAAAGWAVVRTRRARRR
ncbi:hypothetical protein [Blastococcus sp. SYSU DS0533]